MFVDFITIYIFRFPKNVHRREAWIRGCKLNVEIVSDHSVICSKHFKVTDYNCLLTTKCQLHTEAVPFLHFEENEGNQDVQNFQQKENIQDKQNVSLSNLEEMDNNYPDLKNVSSLLEERDINSSPVASTSKQSKYVFIIKMAVTRTVAQRSTVGSTIWNLIRKILI